VAVLEAEIAQELVGQAVKIEPRKPPRLADPPKQRETPWKALDRV
jgi:hypothetical protein